MFFFIENYIQNGYYDFDRIYLKFSIETIDLNYNYIKDFRSYKNCNKTSNCPFKWKSIKFHYICNSVLQCNLNE